MTAATTSDWDAYLALLRQAYENAGRPSCGQIKAATGLSRTTAHHVLIGHHRPQRRVLQDILDYLCPPGDALVGQVIAAYGKLEGGAVKQRGVITFAGGDDGAGDGTDDPAVEAAQVIADALAAGLSEIADAIRSFAPGPAVAEAPAGEALAEDHNEERIRLRLLDWIARRDVTSFTAADALRALKGSRGAVQRLADVLPSLDALVAAGRLRYTVTATGGRYFSFPLNGAASAQSAAG